VKEEPINPALSGLNDSRHVMMRRSSKVVAQQKPPDPESAYRPRPEHRLPPDLEKAFDLDGLDDDGSEADGSGGGKK